MNGEKKFGSANLRMDDAREKQASNTAQLTRKLEEIERKIEELRAKV
jgi:hypothetical protein